MLDKLRFLIQLTEGDKITRRYFVTNGFDGALTIFGIIIGFYAGGDVSIPTVIHACVGAAVALAVSGISSAYVSEVAERENELKELERALIGDLDQTAHGKAAKQIPIIIAAVNGLAPLFMAIAIISPMVISILHPGVIYYAMEWSMLFAFVIIFLLGVFTGTISGKRWLWSGIRTSLIALVTATIITIINISTI